MSAARVAIAPLGTADASAVAELLARRNATSRDYTRQKYSWAEGMGVAAWRGDRMVGCFGLLPRELLWCGGAQPAGWFADWYVLPEERASGIGGALLAALAAQAGVIFGHPGPELARRLCERHGYAPLPFQARRRLVLRPLAYERRRTQHPALALLRAGQRLAHSRSRSHPQTSAACSELGGEGFARWSADQIIAGGAARISEKFVAGELIAHYALDTLRSGERRALILRTTVAGSPAHWRALVARMRELGAIYIDGFTTDTALDAVWARLGAQIVPEPPVLVRGLRAEIPRIHGGDRENFTFLASEA